MAILDTTSALVVIDLQQGIVHGEFAHPIGDMIANAAALAQAFRAAGRPVVHVNATGGAPGRTEAPSAHGPFPPDFAELPASDRRPRRPLPASDSSLADAPATPV